MALVETQRRIFSVTEITRDIRSVLEENFSDLWVEGEISNFKWHSSGHMYFSLKDENAQISCVLFRTDAQKLEFEMKEGLCVLLCGRVSVYPVRGQYQLYVERAEPKGVGALQLRFLQLKEKLMKEGLFDESHKKPVPALPRRIGVVTSIDGAALRDILHVLNRRFSGVSVLVYPVPVQGEGAAEKIAEAIDDLNTLTRPVDVLIVGRGGGSPEDLWAFNEETVARAIFNSRIPVISAVGHEVDFTIADFVADLRAPTPSAAAELVVPRKEDLIVRISDLKARLVQTVFDFEVQFQKLDELKKNLETLSLNFFELRKERLSGLMGRLEALGPLSILKRGYSLSLKLPEEELIRDFRSVRPGDRVKTKLEKGFFISQVKETHP
ncbi:MAG: exodeoxyribonuclease VII large subunit [Candidatus Omnitrophica bacterium]|nr:exodeoxyribonuclease VII large subunit [Candidatus Omnitrophota bacterium]